MYRKLLEQWLETDKAQSLARLEVGATNMLLEFTFWLEQNAAQQSVEPTVTTLRGPVSRITDEDIEAINLI